MYEGNVIEDVVTIVQEKLAVPLLIRWDVSARLRNDVNYPARINNVERGLSEPQTKDIGDFSDNPTETEIEEIKQKLFKEYSDVFTEGESTLKPMACEPSKIELIPEANPIRVSTAKR